MFKKAQSAIEFVILVGGVLFFFLSFMLAIQGNISDKLIENRNLAIQEIALNVQNELNLASIASDGYKRHFDVPLKAAGLDYDILLNEGLVYIETDDGRYSAAFQIPEVNGSISKGNNVITKENGFVFLNP